MKLKHFGTLGPTVLAVLVSLTVAGPAVAADDRPGPKAPSVKDLEDRGYTCEVVATDYIQCTKPGQKTMVCSDHGRICIEQPWGPPVKPPGRPRFDPPPVPTGPVIGPPRTPVGPR